MAIDLAHASAVYIDTNVFIYFLEGAPRFRAASAEVFSAATDMEIPLVASEFALAECLYGAHRMANPALADQYREFFQREAIDLYPVEMAILNAAAALGPPAGLKLPDAIHVATALLAGCDTFITNDASIRGQPGLRIVLLE